MTKTAIERISLAGIKDKIAAIDTDLIVAVVDHNVWTQHSKIFDLQNIDGKKLILWKAPDGEKGKTLTEYQSCTEFLIEKGIHRNAHLVAIGGGAVSDFGGFVASTILRGIYWSIIPTTLLSMVDASIGGKVAVNSKEAKNLIGAFHQPNNVWIEPRFIETLPKAELMSGRGEVLKYAFLDKELHTIISSDRSLEEIIFACAQYKLDLTSADFKEKGRRKILNFGHTIGHALERLYNLPHGEAIVWGIGVIQKVFADGALLDEVRSLRRRLGWGDEKSPWINRDFPIDKVMELVRKDKKSVSTDSLDIVIAREIGSMETKTLSFSEMDAGLRRNLDELKQFTL
jgi:3-dehydroquinate synthetase